MVPEKAKRTRHAKPHQKLDRIAAQLSSNPINKGEICT